MLKQALIFIALVSTIGIAQAQDKDEKTAKTRTQTPAAAAQPQAKKGKADKRNSEEHKLVHACDGKAKLARAADPVARKKMISDCRKA